MLAGAEVGAGCRGWRRVPRLAMNALLFSGICKIRCQKWPSPVPNMRAVLKKASYGTRRVFRGPPCSKQASGVRKEYSVPETPSYGTGRVFNGAKQPTPRTVDSLLLHRTHFLMRAENLDNPALIVKGKTQPDFPWLPYSGIASSTKRTLGCLTVLKNIS